MDNKNYNNDFFSYNGVIGRKNYIINMLILFALYFALFFVRFETFTQFTNIKFILPVLMFMVSLFKFVILMSALSVIYRRIADISLFRSYAFNLAMKRIFVLIYVFPILYLFCLRYFLDIIPFIITALDFTVLYMLFPLGIIGIIIFSFVKSK